MHNEIGLIMHNENGIEEREAIDSLLWPHFPSFGEAIQEVWNFITSLSEDAPPESYHWRTGLQIRPVGPWLLTMTIWAPDSRSRFRLAIVEHGTGCLYPLHHYDTKLSHPSVMSFITTSGRWVIHPMWDGQLARLDVLERFASAPPPNRQDWTFFHNLQRRATSGGCEPEPGCRTRPPAR